MLDRVLRGRRRPDGVGAAHARGPAGLTLIELLVATCVTAVALAGAWPWLWNTEKTSRQMVTRVQVSTSAAFAARTIADDITVATAILPPGEGRSPSHALCLQHQHEGVEPEAVLIVWDAARRVLWRKTASTYLADHVEDFSVTYYDDEGTPLSDADFASAGWAERVVRVSFTVRTSGVGCCTCVTRDCLPGYA